MNIVTKIVEAVREYMAALNETMPQLAGDTEAPRPVVVKDTFGKRRPLRRAPR
jgi:hypothetical protein